MRALYRIFDDEARLLYVGQSANPTRRLGAHIERQEWRYAVAYIAVDWLDDADIDAAEQRAIATERPLFNLEYQPSALTIGRSHRAAGDDMATSDAVAAEMLSRADVFRLDAIVAATGLGLYAVRAVAASLVRAGKLHRVEGGYRIPHVELRDGIEAQLRGNSGMTRTAISQALGLSGASTQRRLRGMVLDGTLVKVGDRYFIPPDTSDTDGRTPVSETGRTGYVVRPVVPAPRTLDRQDN